jgi:hypothetical protein
MKKEQLSTSTQEVPKLKTALLDKIEAVKKNRSRFDQTKKRQQVAEPTGWRLLVLPFKMKN